MIISEQKDFESLLDMIHNASVFLVGCAQCATLCHTGGEQEVIEMKTRLEDHDIQVTGWIILDPACHKLNSKRLFKKVQDEINKADNLLVLSCGNGVQVIEALYPEKTILSGTNTLFLGAEQHRGVFERQCQLCGSCIIDEFNGLCPVSHCPKQMLNGPCGGSMHGTCEINIDHECVWEKIIQKKKKSSMMRFVHPKDWTQYKQVHWREHHKS